MPKKKQKKQTKKKHQYLVLRDEFYEKHPRAKYLLGIFIVATAIFVGMAYYKHRLQIDIGEYLWETEGVLYNPNL